MPGIWHVLGIRYPMNNILLLTDFSAESLHAARYAALLTQQLRSQRLILFHAYQVIMPLPVSDIPVPASAVNEPVNSMIETAEEIRRKSLQALKGLYDQLRQMAYADTIMEYRAEEASLVVSINDVMKETGADVVVMATTGAGFLERVVNGDNTIHIADESKYPVLLVPPGAPLEPVRRIVFACDLKKTEETTPVKGLKKLLDDFRAELLVVNVDHDEKHVTSNTFQSAIFLGKWLEAYRPAYHYIDNPDLVAGIAAFAREHKASLIIAIHKNRGFFEGLFHRSATHQLAKHMPFPLLILKNEKI